MALTSPDITILGRIKFGTTTVTETFSSGSSVFDGVNLTYNAQFEIIPQQSYWPNNSSNPYTYTAYDIGIGWKYNTPAGRVYDVVGINVFNNDSASISIRDTNLREYINSSQDPPNTDPDQEVYGIFIPLTNSIPILSNLTQNAGLFPDQSYWTDDILAHSIRDLAVSGSGGGTGSGATLSPANPNGTGGAGGSGGGGTGSNPGNTNNAQSGTTNTGGGGGGGGYGPTGAFPGGAGGSGIVVIRYKFQ